MGPSSLGLLVAALLNGEPRPIEGLRFDEIHRLVDGAGSPAAAAPATSSTALVMRRQVVQVPVVVMLLVMPSALRRLGRLEGRVRLQVQVQVLDLLLLSVRANDLAPLEEVVDLLSKERRGRQEERRERETK